MLITSIHRQIDRENLCPPICKKNIFSYIKIFEYTNTFKNLCKCDLLRQRVSPYIALKKCTHIVSSIPCPRTPLVLSIADTHIATIFENHCRAVFLKHSNSVREQVPVWPSTKIIRHCNVNFFLGTRKLEYVIRTLSTLLYSSRAAAFNTSKRFHSVKHVLDIFSELLVSGKPTNSVSQTRKQTLNAFWEYTSKLVF